MNIVFAFHTAGPIHMPRAGPPRLPRSLPAYSFTAARNRRVRQGTLEGPPLKAMFLCCATLPIASFIVAVVAAVVATGFQTIGANTLNESSSTTVLETKWLVKCSSPRLDSFFSTRRLSLTKQHEAKLLSNGCRQTDLQQKHSLLPRQSYTPCPEHSRPPLAPQPLLPRHRKLPSSTMPNRTVHLTDPNVLPGLRARTGESRASRLACLARIRSLGSSMPDTKSERRSAAWISQWV